MTPHRDWFIRRLKRTTRLLASGKTRGDMLRFLGRHVGIAAIAHARGYARTQLRANRS